MDLPRYGVCPMASLQCVMQLKTFCRTQLERWQRNNAEHEIWERCAPVFGTHL